MSSQNKETIQNLFDTAKAALLAGGRILQKKYSKKNSVSFKSPLSPVTEVDRHSEKKIISAIRRRFPHHGFLAEEMKHDSPELVRDETSNKYRWIIDPLDGTVNYIHKIPQSCVSVAVEKGGVLLAGGVYDPHRHELFMAARGKGAVLNGRRIRVSPARDLKDSLIITGFPYDRNDNAGTYLMILLPFLERCADLRRFGAAALDLAWIACGRAEAFIEYKLNPWDVAAGALLVKEAGGKITDFLNHPYNIDRPTQTFASNGRVHKKMAALFKRHFNKKAK